MQILIMLCLMPFMVVVSTIGVVTIIWLGPAFPSMFYKIVFVMITATVVYTGIGLALGIRSIGKIWGQQECKQYLKESDWITLAILILVAMGTAMCHWVDIYLARLEKS